MNVLDAVRRSAWSSCWDLSRWRVEKMAMTHLTLTSVRLKDGEQLKDNRWRTKYKIEDLG